MDTRFVLRIMPQGCDDVFLLFYTRLTLDTAIMVLFGRGSGEGGVACLFYYVSTSSEQGYHLLYIGGATW